MAKLSGYGGNMTAKISTNSMIQVAFFEWRLNVGHELVVRRASFGEFYQEHDHGDCAVTGSANFTVNFNAATSKFIRTLPSSTTGWRDVLQGDIVLYGNDNTVRATGSDSKFTFTGMLYNLEISRSNNTSCEGSCQIANTAQDFAQSWDET